jgi:hypothetical protein
MPAPMITIFFGAGLIAIDAKTLDCARLTPAAAIALRSKNWRLFIRDTSITFTNLRQLIPFFGVRRLVAALD